MGDGVKAVKLVTVSCVEHHETLVKRLWHFFKTGQRLDFDFPSDGNRPILAHMLVVDAFMSLDNFSLDRKAQRNSGRDTSSCLDSLLEFMYRGTVSVPEDGLQDLLETAKEFDFKMLVDAVEETVKRNGRKSRTRRRPVKMEDADVAGLQDDVDNVSEPSGDESTEESCPPVKKKRLPGRPRGRKRGKRCAVSAPRGRPPVSSAQDGLLPDKRCTRKITTPVIEPHDHIYASIPQQAAPKRRAAATPVHRCPSCDDAFVTRGALSKHQSERHDDVEQVPATYCCSLCKFQTRMLVTYKAHLFNSHNLNMYGEELRKDLHCEQCDYSCVRPSELRHHELSKHSTEKPFKCPLCPYAAAMRKDLYVHNMRTHLRVRNYPCDQCDLKFHNNYALSRHRRTHTGERPYVCEVCGKAYSDMATLKWHSHCHGESDDHHVCHMCGHLSKRRQYLKAHFINIHKMDVMTATATAAAATKSRNKSTNVTVEVEVFEETSRDSPVPDDTHVELFVETAEESPPLFEVRDDELFVETSADSPPPFESPQETDPPFESPQETDPPFESPQETDPPFESPQETDPPFESPQQTDPPFESPQETDPPFESPQETDPPFESPQQTDPPFESPQETDPPFESPQQTDPPFESPQETDPPFESPQETDPPVLVALELVASSSSALSTFD